MVHCLLRSVDVFCVMFFLRLNAFFVGWLSADTLACHDTRKQCIGRGGGNHGAQNFIHFIRSINNRQRMLCVTTIWLNNYGHILTETDTAWVSITADCHVRRGCMSRTVFGVFARLYDWTAGGDSQTRGTQHPGHAERQRLRQHLQLLPEGQPPCALLQRHARPGRQTEDVVPISGWDRFFITVGVFVSVAIQLMTVHCFA